jgi:aspartate racemase
VTVGIICGIGPKSTIEFYRLIIANKLKEKDCIQGLILGGTELPLILKETDADEIDFLDTTRIHVESIMKRLS